MFAKLFAESGLSLDRLKTLLEVGASGSIVKAADGDPVRQSQYSRQIKELEDFFRVKLVERQGKGTRLTPKGKELARISRFFLLGLSNFQQGCLAEEQVFRIGASATYLRHFFLPALLSQNESPKSVAHYATETASNEEIEQRLHNLTLDFGIVNTKELSHPLQLKQIGKWTLELWVPKALGHSQKRAAEMLKAGELPLAIASRELADASYAGQTELKPFLVCDTFVDARFAMESERLAAILPDFLAPIENRKNFFMMELREADILTHHLAWNPRLLRLNPHANNHLAFLLNVLTR